MIRLIEAGNDDRKLLWSIHQKYLYEMTRYYDNEMDENGDYHYGYFDAYFTEAARKAFLIYDDRALAGFAMVNPYSYFEQAVDYVMAEFTVFPMYRKKGIGMAAAEQILNSFRGKWEIKYNEKNSGAMEFWNRVCARWNPVKHRFSDEEIVLEFETLVDGGVSSR